MNIDNQGINTFEGRIADLRKLATPEAASLISIGMALKQESLKFKAKYEDWYTTATRLVSQSSGHIRNMGTLPQVGPKTQAKMAAMKFGQKGK